MKETNATSHFEITVDCPYCDRYQERTADLRENLINGTLGEDDVNDEITCNNCGKEFIVKDIEF